MKLSKILTRQILSPIGMLIKGDVLLRKISPNNILNIMYHGVVRDDSTSFSPRHIHIDQFEKQIKYLKREFDIITLEEAFECKKNGNTTKNKSLTITFDDGYVNNFKVALPLLETYNIRPTFFISSICLENDDYILWSDIIAALNYFFKNQIIEFSNDKFLNSKSISTGKQSIFDLIKSLSPEQRDLSLQELIARYDLITLIKSLPEEIWRLMNKQELVAFSKSKSVSVGSHGHLHYNLANISKEEAKQELQKSKNLLEKCLNIDVKAIAYPDGSYDEEIKNIAESLGYSQQFAVNYKLKKDMSDSRILNRHGISSTTTFEANMLLLNRSFLNKGF